MNKKIYIAGCGGMLGEAFYNVFSKKYFLKCTDINLNEKWLDYLDFRDFESYEKDVKKFKPDYLFHIGAHTDLEYCEQNQKDAFDTNTISVRHAVSISNDLNIPIIFISTAGIFDGKKKFYDEKDKPKPISFYAKTKYEAEIFVQNKAKKYLICRPGWMMGGGPKKDKKFINKIIKKINNNEKELFVVNDKSGTPTYTYDLANNLKLLIEKEKWGLFNMVCLGSANRFEVANELIKILRLHKTIKITQVSSDYWKKNYFAARPDCESLINKKLDDIKMNLMRNWKVCLSEYLKNHFKF